MTTRHYYLHDGVCGLTTFLYVPEAWDYVVKGATHATGMWKGSTDTAIVSGTGERYTAWFFTARACDRIVSYLWARGFTQLHTCPDFE